MKFKSNLINLPFFVVTSPPPQLNSSLNLTAYMTEPKKDRCNMHLKELTGLKKDWGTFCALLTLITM
jgi:hypothetical protein